MGTSQFAAHTPFTAASIKREEESGPMEQFFKFFVQIPFSSFFHIDFMLQAVFAGIYTLPLTLCWQNFQNRRSSDTQ